MKNKFSLSIIYVIILLLIPLSSDCKIIPSISSEKKTREVKDIARSITVRVFSIGTEHMGSGVLIDKKKTSEGYEYRVLTAAHVMGSTYQKECSQFPNGGKIKVETPDGKNFGVILSAQSKELCKKADLALLSFSSNLSIPYEIVPLGSTNDFKLGEEVYVSGFPCSRDACDQVESIFIGKGAVYKLKEPLIYGYQLGYKISTRLGTSGGAVLNNKGQLVGIHARGISNEEYVTSKDQDKFLSGKNMSKDELKIISANAWAVPSEQFISLISQQPKITKNKNLPITEPISKSAELSNLTLQNILSEMEQYREEIKQYKSKNSLENERAMIIPTISMVLSIATIVLLIMRQK